MDYLVLDIAASPLCT